MTQLLNGRAVPATRKEFITPFDALFDQMIGKAFPSFEREFGVEFFGNNSYPKVDVIDTEDSIEFEAEIPGLDKKDVSVEIEEGILSISGEKRIKEEENITYLKKELKKSTTTLPIKTSNIGPE